MKRESILFLIVALVLLFVSCASNTVRVSDGADFSKYRYISIDNSLNAAGVDVSGLVSSQMSRSDENNQTNYDLINYPSRRQLNDTIMLSYKCEISGNYVKTQVLLNDAATGDLLASNEGSDPIMHNYKGNEEAEKAIVKRLTEIKKILNDSNK